MGRAGLVEGRVQGRVHACIRGIVLAVAAVTALGGAGGCAYKRSIDVSVKEPAEGWPERSALDVQNFHGSVRIIVDPSLERIVPTAVAGARQPWSEGIQWRPAEAVSVVMDVERQPGGNVLKVRTGAMWPNPEEVWVDLTIRVPACSGVTIWNRGGLVELVGVSGAVQVENGPVELPDGSLGSSNGDILLRTDQAMLEPVALVTSRGSVLYQVGPNSAGMFELIAEGGKEEFHSPLLRPDRMEHDGRTLRASVNRGTNHVLLRSDDGWVRAEIIEDPMHDRHAWP
jgi:hypothetical protein